MIFPSNSHPISYLMTSLSLPHPGHGQDPCHALVLADGPAASTLRGAPRLRPGRRRRRAAGAGPSTARGSVDRGGDGAELRATKVSSELGRTGGEMLGVREGVENSLFFCVCFFLVWVMSSEDLIVKWDSENVEKTTGSPGSRDFGTKTVEVSQCFTDTRPVLHAKQWFSSTCLGQQVVSQLLIGVWFYVFQFHLYFIFNTPWQVAAHLPFFACFSSWFGWNLSLSQLLLEGLPVSWAWCCRTANFKSLKPKARSRCGKRWRTEGWEGSFFCPRNEGFHGICHGFAMICHSWWPWHQGKNDRRTYIIIYPQSWLSNGVHDLFSRDAATTWFFLLSLFVIQVAGIRLPTSHF